MYEVEITPRLMPGIKLADGTWISVEPADRTNERGKPRWNYYIEGPDVAYAGADLAGYGNARQMLASLLAFLGACGSSLRYEIETGSEAENTDLFPAHVAEWAMDNADEISIAEFDLDNR